MKKKTPQSLVSRLLSNRPLLVALVALVVVAGGVAFGRGELLTGRFIDWQSIRVLGDEKGGNGGGKGKGKGGFPHIIYWKDISLGRTVSIVVSAVPSVVPTKIPTVVASPVGSPVPVTPVAEKALSTKPLPAYSPAAKKAAEDADKQNNPGKYVVSEKMKTIILKMYNAQHRR